MRIHWEALRQSFVSTAHSHEALRQFGDLRARHREISRFQEPDALLDWLHAADGCLDDKDLALAALVRVVQADGHDRDLASALLWLAAWPGLDNRYRRRLKHFRDQPEELVALISLAFTTVIAKMNLTRVRRVAASLVRSTDREVLETCRRQWAVLQKQDQLPEATYFLRRNHPRGRVAFPLLAAKEDWNEAQIDSLRRRLGRVVSDDDADLLIRALVLGESLREVADQTGRPYETVKKRVQRAGDLFRRAVTEELSRIAPRTCVSPLRARGPRKGGTDHGGARDRGRT